MSEEQVEILRQLRAARDGRLLVNEHGRYVISGEERPNRKVRECLIYSRRCLIWTFNPSGLVLTGEGRRVLEHLEATHGSKERS